MTSRRHGRHRAGLSLTTRTAFDPIDIGAGETTDEEDPSGRLLDVETQLGWLREYGFEDVDCYWQWLEMALLVGVKPTEPR